MRPSRKGVSVPFGNASTLPAFPYILVATPPGFVVWSPPFSGSARTLLWVRNIPTDDWAGDMVLQPGDTYDEPDWDDGAECKIATDPDGSGFPVQDLSNVVILSRSVNPLAAPVVTLIDGSFTVEIPKASVPVAPFGYQIATGNVLIDLNMPGNVPGDYDSYPVDYTVDDDPEVYRAEGASDFEYVVARYQIGSQWSPWSTSQFTS